MSERWKPEDGETFWYFDCYGRVFPLTYHGDSYDFKFMAFGNMFKTEEEAKSAVENVKALLLSLQEPFTDCKQLPKLTAEVFDRPDCPAWAKYAAVDADGGGFYYEDKPRACEADGEWLVDKCIVGTNCIITGDFDPTDWQNSLIESPIKLPEWCKVGEWFYCDNVRIGKYGYFKITKIESDRLYVDDEYYCLIHNAKKAHLRPYNSEEMKALVGKVIENKYYTHFISRFDKKSQEVVSGSDSYSAKDLVAYGYTINGKPCGALEHLNEKGEWVE